MQNSISAYILSKWFRVFISTLVIFFGLIIIIIPVLKTASLSGGVSEAFNNGIILGILLGIVFALFLPNIIYSIITMKTKEIEYIILPALSLFVAEYFFFHNYSTWISSDANAAIALVIMPIYLNLFLGISYGLSFMIIKIRKRKG